MSLIRQANKIFDWIDRVLGKLATNRPAIATKTLNYNPHAVSLLCLLEY